MTGEFLLEVLCEEIPANALPGAREQLTEGFKAELAEAGFAGFEVKAASTVRRLVVSVVGLPERQPDREEEVQGPSVKAAFTGDGSPTQAATGFAKALGVSVEELKVVKGPKGEVIAGVRHLAGRPTPEVLGEITRRVVTGLRFPKTMRWGCGEHTFVRPVHNVVALFGARELRTLVPVELFGVASTTSTVGHRVVSPGRIELRAVTGFSAYAEMLARGGVVIEPAVRRGRLERAAAKLAAEVGCAVRPDEALVAEHVELLEHPGIVRGEIEERFLGLPEEVLVTTLRHHQKCLVLTREGRVAPYLLAVCDRPDDLEGHVRRGNEWVAGARLADAAFFFEHDRKQPLAAREAALERVMLHQKLGSYAEKARRVVEIAHWMVERLGREDAWDEVQKACRLAKVDLVTAMVGEFPELQGVVGGLYARLDGEPDEVWQAIYDQYSPAGLEGGVPRTFTGAVLGVADRLDTLVGLFAAGEVPSGSKDPFALRRAALAVARICAELPLALDLEEAVSQAVRQWHGKFPGKVEEARPQVVEFLKERVRYVLTASTGVAADVTDAALGARWGVVPDTVARAKALQAVRQEPVFEVLATAFKRVRNIVAKGGDGRFEAKLLKEEAEKQLLASVGKVEREVEKVLKHDDYAAALRSMTQLAEPLDRFFTDVMVMCEDEKVRAARLGLLANVERLFLRVADLSCLSP